MRPLTLTTSLISPSGTVLLHRASCSTAYAEEAHTRTVRVQMQADNVRRPVGVPVAWAPQDDATAVDTV